MRKTSQGDGWQTAYTRFGRGSDSNGRCRLLIFRFGGTIGAEACRRNDSDSARGRSRRGRLGRIKRMPALNEPPAESPDRRRLSKVASGITGSTKSAGVVCRPDGRRWSSAAPAPARRFWRRRFSSAARGRTMSRACSFPSTKPAPASKSIRARSAGISRSWKGESSSPSSTCRSTVSKSSRPVSTTSKGCSSGSPTRSTPSRRVEFVLDSIDTLFANVPNEAVLRAELRRLFAWLRDRALSTVVTCERGAAHLSRHGIEEYVSDCVILLDSRVYDEIATRRLRVSSTAARRMAATSIRSSSRRPGSPLCR